MITSSEESSLPLSFPPPFIPLQHFALTSSLPPCFPSRSDLSVIVTLEGNGTGPEGIVYLGDALSTNSTLTFLNLAGNNIRLEGAKALAQSLKRNSTLSSAVLRRNAVGDEVREREREP